MVKEYPGDSLSQVFSEGLYLKLYPLADTTAVEWKGPQKDSKEELGSTNKSYCLSSQMVHLGLFKIFDCAY